MDHFFSRARTPPSESHVSEGGEEMETEVVQGRDNPTDERPRAAGDDSPIADHVSRDLLVGRNVAPADLRDALIVKVNERSMSLATSGVPIYAWNGRDAIGDAIGPAVDLVSYLRQGMIEW